jgi:hypothetical protein
MQRKFRTLAGEDGAKANTEERRQLLRAMLGATAGSLVFGRRWIEPAIEAVVLPAHAQASLGAGARFTLLCNINSISADGTVDFGYTPQDAANALNGQLVDTVYELYDGSALTQPFFTNTITTSRFGVLVSPATGYEGLTSPVTLRVYFADQSTYGSSECTANVNFAALPFPAEPA